jgi:hypothetical protein
MINPVWCCRYRAFPRFSNISAAPPFKSDRLLEPIIADSLYFRSSRCDLAWDVASDFACDYAYN